MDKKKVKEIIKSYIDGNASQKDEKLLNDFLDSYQVNKSSDEFGFDQSKLKELKEKILSSNL